MKVKTYTFSYPDGSSYDVEVVYKRQRGLYLYHRNGVFYATVPLTMRESHVKEFIYKNIPVLSKRIAKRTPKESPKGDNYTYLLGERTEQVLSEKELKTFALKYLTELTRECEKEMVIRPYNVRIRKMKSRYGSNSLKTRSINYQLDLIHYDREIIRSVVVHELAHDKHRNHQKGFYKLVLQYCPNYWELRRKLRKGIYK